MQPDEFEVIDPAATTATVCGQPIEVKPLTVGQIPKVMRQLQGLDLGALDTTNPAAIAELVMAHSEQVVEALAVATRQAAADIERMELDEFLRLFAIVIEVNSDFFVQRVAPALQMMLLRVRGQMAAGRGQTPSSN